MKRFEEIGLQIMNRTGGAYEHNPIANVLGDPAKRAMAAQILGQAYLHAHHLVLANKPAVERIADVLVEKREIYGDDVVNLLDSIELKVPQIDVTDEDAWPKL